MKKVRNTSKKMPRASLVLVEPETLKLLIRLSHATGRSKESIMHLSLRLFAGYALKKPKPEMAEPKSRGGPPTRLPIKPTLRKIKETPRREDHYGKSEC